jgi:uncharacterized protein YecE (DUF72 family)
VLRLVVQGLARDRLPRRSPQRLWFEHYQGLFDTVELNSTFYRLPSTKAIDRWADVARLGFVYAVKVGAFGSHRMKLRDAASWLPNHLARVERLGEHLGPNLVQLPPRWKRNAERLDEFLSCARRRCAGPSRTYVRFHGPDALHHAYHGAYGDRRLESGSHASGLCSMPAETSTPTSTTTSTAMPCATPSISVGR